MIEPENLLKFLEDGLKQVNIEYISHPEFTIDDYRGMCVQYILSALLIQLGQSGNCGLYSHPDSVGYIGWLSIGDCSLFFAPTAITILRGEENKGNLLGGSDYPY